MDQSDTDEREKHNNCTERERKYVHSERKILCIIIFKLKYIEREGKLPLTDNEIIT